MLHNVAYTLTTNGLPQARTGHFVLTGTKSPVRSCDKPLNRVYDNQDLVAHVIVIDSTKWTAHFENSQRCDTNNELFYGV